ncbi:hypothetical protein BR93DRAFT_669865 [Coniochaeta sp. PMI_546]|nr:hypothetical protein BR93DRAFT_669865 [Coniochaeta sp. PMI_546]
MYISRAFVAALAAGVGFLQYATAHSTERNHLSYISRIEDAVIHTPSHRVHAHSTFELSFRLHDGRQKVRLTLSPNHDILSEDAVVNLIGPDGTVQSVEQIDRSEHRIFKGDAFVKRPGHSEWTNVGWARIAVHRDGEVPVFEGAFRVDGDHHHIQTGEHYRHTGIIGDPEVEEDRSDEYMVVWRDSDIVGNGGSGHDHDELKRDLSGTESCTSDSLLFNRDVEHPVYRGLDERDAEAENSFWSMNPRALFGRQIDGTTSGNGAGVNLASTIGSTAGCPTTRKVALIGIATDCTYTAKFNSTSAIRSHIISTINSASQLYESTFNISLGIQNLTISNETCPSTPAPNTPWNIGCSGSTTITDRLNLFSKWRGQFNDTNAYWTLLSTCGTDSAVGLAWLGQVCVQGSQESSANNQNETIAAANVVVWTSTEWQVIAHETGHTFGAVHDCTSQTCSDGTVTKQQCCPLSQSSCNANAAFIMNPSTGGGITQFSPCSVGNICSAIGRNSVKSNCLTNNRDVSTIAESQCGNGIVEQGEDCDCGGTQGCGTNPCCNPTTCKFTTNAVCDPANEECCTSSCRFASNGTVCRASTGVCDPQETCTGASPNCPADVTAPDGTGCGASGAGLACASGQCTSRDLQCKTLMGSISSGNDTHSCNSQGCQLSCASPEFGPNMCFTMQQNFLDGTSCQGGGKCSNGACQGASVGNEISSWINDNKPIFIPVVSAVGGIIVLAILACCINACRKRRRARRAPKPPPPGWNMYGGPPGMPMRPGWQASRGMQGPVYGTIPPGQMGMPHPQRTFSARYA